MGLRSTLARVFHGKCVGFDSGMDIRGGYSQLRHRVPSTCFSLDSASVFNEGNSSKDESNVDVVVIHNWNIFNWAENRRRRSWGDRGSFAHPFPQHVQMLNGGIYTSLRRVIGFFSSRPKWDPLTWGECVLPSFGSGKGKGVEESQFRRGDRHCGTRGILYMSFVLHSLHSYFRRINNFRGAHTLIKNQIKSKSFIFPQPIRYMHL